ncbi:cell division inhibitor SepF [Georgenia satyanarayanai]|uniref:Cell division protein SepF n=1 Tax=Georgenia satyanarayanai TaxID=860221 RepID=A0A2Y9AC78_9MICO|nr:cell division protein SepF [Georgenia satyanarayanai]PYF99823.1 cell division inhibitor SepF [Georgenia satyanarayanai]SSA41805.1 cell division inhibitor SepF [Georgenia satyanarayanai]
MAGALRKTMAYLGLSEDEGDYVDELDVPRHEEPAAAEARPEREEPRAQVTPMRVVPAPEPVEHDLRRISTVHPATYNEARVIGEAFRDGTPVIMNLTGMSETEAKRMVDFSAGLVFGLHGSIERVTNRVFLLSPASVEVASDSGQPETGPGRLFNQS